jgi:hypothetical protein
MLWGMTTRKLAYQCVAAGLALGLFLASVLPALGARNSAGTYSLPSGQPVVAGTTITASTHNTLASDIASELTNSLDRQGRGAMLAALQGYAGTQAAPGFTFTSDTDSGLYRAGAGDVRMSVNNTYVQRWQDSAITMPVPLTVSHSTAATAATRQDAISATNGDISLSGVTSPNADVAITNRVTPMNFAKFWGHVTLTGNASPTVNGGFNITSVTCGSNVLTVTIAGDLANANYAAIVTSDFNDFDGNPVALFAPHNLAAGSFVITAQDSSAAVMNLCDGTYTGAKVFFVGYGAQ